MKGKLLVSLLAAAPLVAVGVAAADRFKGTTGDDLIGTMGADVISSLAGNDTIDGEGGNDAIYAGTGNDTVLGGGGNDRIRGGERGCDLGRRRRRRPAVAWRTDTINGGDGNDVIGRKRRGHAERWGRERPDARARQRRPARSAGLRPRRRVAIVNARERESLVSCERVIERVPTPSQAPRTTLEAVSRTEEARRTGGHPRVGRDRAARKSLRIQRRCRPSWPVRPTSGRAAASPWPARPSRRCRRGAGGAR